MNDRIAMNIKLTRKSTDKLFDRFLFYSLFFFFAFSFPSFLNWFEGDVRNPLRNLVSKNVDFMVNFEKINRNAKKE